MLVDLREGAVEEDDGGVVETLERVVARVLEVVLQPGEGGRHFRRRRRRGAGKRIRRSPRGVGEAKETRTGGWRR